MNYLKKLGLVFSMASIFMCLSAGIVSAQPTGQNMIGIIPGAPSQPETYAQAGEYQLLKTASP